MAFNYQTLSLRDFGSGMDQQSAETSVREGFSESLTNVDPKPEGYLTKRKGYQGYCGFVPARVFKVEYSDDATENLCLFLDDSIDLSTVRSSPIIVQGRTSSANTNNAGDFPTDADTVKYYSGFTADVRKEFSTGTNTLSIPESEHGISSNLLAVGVTESTSLTNNSNSVFDVDSVEITKANNLVEVTYTNGTGSAFNGFVYISDRTAGASDFVSGTTSILTGTNTYTTTQATHNLNNNQILVTVYEDDGTKYKLIKPDSVEINTSGDVDITITNGTGSAFNAIFILHSVPTVNSVTGSIASGNTLDITISSLDNDFLFARAYLEQTIGGTLEEVIPNSITVDALTSTATVSFQNNTGSSTNFFVYYDTASISTNKLCVDASVIGGGDVFTDTRPQLTLWGLSHSEIYGTKSSSKKEGWVNHIDSYRSIAQNKVVTGLGGNLFEAGGTATNFLLTTKYPNLRERTASAATVGPVFWETGATPALTRGYITADNGASNFLEISAVAFDSGTGWVKYTIEAPSLLVNGTLSTIINVDQDYLTVQQTGYSVNNGTFLIKAVTTGTDQIFISVLNSSRNTDDFDETDVGGRAGIFTDSITLSGDSPFLDNDRLLSDLFTDDLVIEVQSSSGTTVVIRGVDDKLEIPAGLRVLARRDSYVLPLRLLDGTTSVSNLVRGDMLSVTNVTRLLRVVSINPNSNLSVTIDGTGTTATATLSSGDTTKFKVGQKLLFLRAGVYSGVQEITSIPSLTTIQFSSTQTSTGVSGVIHGNTVELDEQFAIEDTANNTISYTTPCRWIPIEAPDDSFGNTPSTYIQHFTANDYDNQPFLRSVMVSDNLYLTNGDDEVFKYDGNEIYRAGLPRWQAQLFITTDTTPASGGTIDFTPVESTTVTAVSGTKFTLTGLEDRNVFSIGDRIQHSNDKAKYTVVDVSDNGTNAIIHVSSAISGAASGNLSFTNTYRYYFRLNAVDTNQNLIASAVVGAEDNVVELGESAQVRLRLVGFPAWDIYDYDRLEVEIYRTQANTQAPYFKLATIPMNFNNNTGYIDYIDTDADDVLRDLDQVNTAILGQELGTQFSIPLRAKYITSAGNRLILGNIQDFPQLDIQLIDTGSRINVAALNGDIYTFRRDNTNTSTTTDMLNVARYEFVNTSTSVSISTPEADQFRVNFTGHSLSVGDWIYLFHVATADGDNVSFSGWWQVSEVVDVNNIDIDFPDRPAAGSGDADRIATATTTTDIPVYLGTDGNYTMFNGNKDTTSAYESVALRRLANAINTSMRMTNRGLSGQSSFEPWMIAEAGGEFNVGQLRIRQPKQEDTTLEVGLPSFSGFNIFVNSILRTSGTEISAIQLQFPSRIIASPPNFPEIFDNPRALIDDESPSAIDVNSADGQEITGIIPFFGDAAFGASQKDGVVVVFKTNSIYLVNLAAKAQGLNPVQKLESRGLGCTAPFSITVTRNGINFANESGIYQLTRQLTVEYVGQKIERLWREDVNQNKLAIMQGHHFPIGNQYKLSVPTSTDFVNSKVFVYDHTREYRGQGFGSWTQYDNHPATGWANLSTDAYFSTTDGQVFSIRRASDVTDFRDDAAAISMEAILRAWDFGDAGIRKVIGKLVAHFRSISDMNGTAIFSAPDLTEEFDQLDAFSVDISTDETTGLSDTSGRKVISIRFSINKRKLVYVQLKLTNSTIDEPVELTHIDFRVAGMTAEGITQAARTT